LVHFHKKREKHLFEKRTWNLDSKRLTQIFAESSFFSETSGKLFAISRSKKSNIWAFFFKIESPKFRWKMKRLIFEKFRGTFGCRPSFRGGQPHASLGCCKCTSLHLIQFIKKFKNSSLYSIPKKTQTGVKIRVKNRIHPYFQWKISQNPSYSLDCGHIVTAFSSQFLTTPHIFSVKTQQQPRTHMVGEARTVVKIWIWRTFLPKFWTNPHF